MKKNILVFAAFLFSGQMIANLPINADSNIPVFGTCSDLEFCGSNADCTADLVLTNTVIDDCTPSGSLLVVDFKIDVFNDGTYDFIGSNINPYPYPNPDNLPIINVSFSSTNVNGVYEMEMVQKNYPVGTHRILWNAADVCSNVGTCEYLFTAKDCVKPTPKAFYGLAFDLNPVNSEVFVVAAMLDAGSFDNCGIQQFRIGSAEGPGQLVPPDTDTLFLSCNEFGTYSIDFWVQDVNGNWDYVESFIHVQNSLGANCGPPFPLITGQIENEAGSPLDGVTVELRGNAPNLPISQITGNDGKFTFFVYWNNNNYEVYEVEATKDDDARNGVSTLDLILISRHLIGLQLLNSPYKLIAADVDNSGTINTFDLLAIQRLILYIDTELASNTSWRFVDADYVFANPMNPWVSPFPEVIAFNGLTGQNIADFVAVKIGDVNGNAQTNAVAQSGDRNFYENLNFYVEDFALVPGEEFTVAIKASPEGLGFTKMLGYQFTLNLDQNAVELVDIIVGEALDGLSTANFGLSRMEDGVLTANWASAYPQSLETGETIFSLILKAKPSASGILLNEALSINSRYTPAEAYNENLELLNIGLKFNGPNASTGQGFTLYQNQPNPFQEETVIGFNLPEAGAVKVSIYDVNGKILKVINGNYAKGYSQVKITRNELAASGVLYYQVDTANDSKTRKMILIE